MFVRSMQAIARRPRSLSKLFEMISLTMRPVRMRGGDCDVLFAIRRTMRNTRRMTGDDRRARRMTNDGSGAEARP
jgi:hypothetical protein